MPALLHEIEVASYLGYQKWTKFARDLREGRVPTPTRIEGNTKLWSKAKLDAWIDGEDERGASSADLMKRLERVR